MFFLTGNNIYRFIYNDDVFCVPDSYGGAAIEITLQARLSTNEETSSGEFRCFGFLLLGRKQ
jgi:hypothetical protein